MSESFSRFYIPQTIIKSILLYFISYFVHNQFLLFLTLNLLYYTMSQQTDQQITQKYLFVITPLEIKSNSKIKTTNRKAILIKLSNKTAKCTELNTPLQLQIDVLYSKTLKKYCPIKGIIKIYDVSEDGSEIISCVGGFQTDQLLNQGKYHQLLQKEIGTSKLRMEITIKNKNQKKIETETVQSILKTQQSITTRQRSLTKKQQPQKSGSTTVISTAQKLSTFSSQTFTNPLRKLSNSSPNNQTSSIKPLQIPFKNTSSNINKSLQKINQALNFKRLEESNISTKANQVLIKAELQPIKQQLTEQKRKVALYQEKHSKTNQKLSNYKTYLFLYQNQLKSYMQSCKKLVSVIYIKNLSPVTHFDTVSQNYCIKYKSKEIDQIFKDLVSYVSNKSYEQMPNLQIDIESIETSRSLHELQQAKRQLTILKKLATQKDKKIFSLEKQLQGVQITIKNLKQTNKNLSEENRYLRTRNNEIEQNLYHKELNLQSVCRQVEKLKENLIQQERKYNNSCLQIQQLKEEIFNCSETIEKYRQKYGEMKNVKNRAIEMEIKDCLRWIQLQNRDMEMSEIQNTAHSSENLEDNSLSSVIRNIQIQKMPKEEMTVIRDELVRILQKVDNLMSK